MDTSWDGRPLWVGFTCGHVHKKLTKFVVCGSLWSETGLEKIPRRLRKKFELGFELGIKLGGLSSSAARNALNLDKLCLSTKSPGCSLSPRRKCSLRARARAR
eukprot:803714-Prorocentrum_minimum.AAC.1